MHQLNSLIGAHNDRLNKEFQAREDEFSGKLKVGDMILVRNLPKENARMGLKYKKNIFKIIERKGRKLKAVAQFKGLELVTIHVKNAKLFRYNKELQFLPDSIKKFFIAPHSENEAPSFVKSNRPAKTASSVHTDVSVSYTHLTLPTICSV